MTIDKTYTDLMMAARTDETSRAIIGDYWEERGRPDVARLWRDELSDAPRKHGRIENLTKKQESEMPKWAAKWISIGLSTESADRPLFEAAIASAYRRAKLTPPKVVVWCQSPIVAVMAGPIAARIIGDGAVGDAVRGVVDDAVNGAVCDAVCDAVGGAVGGAVRGAVGDAVSDAVGGAVDG
jgi:hypothetical protein